MDVVSVMATRMCVTPQTPQTPSGEIFGSLPIPCIPCQPGGGGLVLLPAMSLVPVSCTGRHAVVSFPCA